LLIILGVIWIPGSIAHVNYKGTAQESEWTKLESDVKTVKAVILLYLANG
jgi:hypothetical protein